jgi:hypothetical protein
MTSIEYTHDIQELFLRMMMTDAQLYSRVSNIMNSENFNKTLKPAARFMVEYSEKYNCIPDAEKIRATCGIKLETIDELRDSDVEWFLDEFESFTRRQELERAILKSAELLEKAYAIEQNERIHRILIEVQGKAGNLARVTELRSE